MTPDATVPTSRLISAAGVDRLPAIFAGTVSLNNIAELVTLSNINKIAVCVYNNKYHKDGD